MEPKNKPVSGKLPRKQAAYEYIKEKILSCEYEPGALMNEQQLCDDLELSRTPVRDALGRLEQEGLVSIIPKKGLVVSDLKLNDINRIYEVRLLLEPYALRRYGRKLDRARLTQFQELLSDLDRVQCDPTYYYDLDDQLHGFIVQAMPNRYLIDTYENIKNLNRRLRVLSGSEVENRIADTCREHLDIVLACLREDWEGAAEAMKKHLEASRVASFYLMIDDESGF